MIIISRRCTLLTLSIIVAIIIQNISAQHISQNEIPSGKGTASQTKALRQPRATRKPGFFWTFGSSLFQQYNETKSAISQIRNLIDDQFINERQMAAAKTSTTPAPSAASTQQSTSPAPFRISRQEFNRILMRNLKGLVRLYNLELDTALKQSNINRADFNKQLRQSIKQQLS